MLDLPCTDPEVGALIVVVLCGLADAVHLAAARSVFIQPVQAAKFATRKNLDHYKVRQDDHMLPSTSDILHENIFHSDLGAAYVEGLLTSSLTYSLISWNNNREIAHIVCQDRSHNS